MELTEFKTKTIAEAQAYMRPLLKEGVQCPCCLGRAQLYFRPLTSAMIYGLILLSKASEKEKDIFGFIHFENFFKTKDCPSSVRGDIPKLRYWGFIMPDGEESGDGNPCNGRYKVLPKGIQFIQGKILVQKTVKLYNNKFYGFEGAETDVFACIKNKFDYNVLMGFPDGKRHGNMWTQSKTQIA